MSCGSSGTGETRQTQSVEEAHRPPRSSLSSLERKSTDNIVGEKQLFIRKRLKLASSCGLKNTNLDNVYM
ncbi:hypothetical protein VL14_18205 [Cytobacillus firmus]|jgi:hypothetical protein|nr:hypothetical protein VL14_18205 [Cytobacillus firmus]